MAGMRIKKYPKIFLEVFCEPLIISIAADRPNGYYAEGVSSVATASTAAF